MSHQKVLLNSKSIKVLKMFVPGEKCKLRDKYLPN